MHKALAMFAHSFSTDDYPFGGQEEEEKGRKERKGEEWASETLQVHTAISLSLSPIWVQ